MSARPTPKTPSARRLRYAFIFFALALTAHMLYMLKPDWERRWGDISVSGMEHLEAGRYEQALAPAEEALGIAEREFGPKDIRTVYTVDLLARVRRRLGEKEKARELFERAVRTNETILAPFNPRKAYYLRNLGGVLVSQEKFDEAEPLYTKALMLDRKAYGEFSRPVATDWVRLGDLFLRCGLDKKAGQSFRRAEAIADRIEEPAPALEADVSAGLCALRLRGFERPSSTREGPGWRRGLLLSGLGHVCQRALTFRRLDLDERHPDLGEAYALMGRLLLQQRRLAAAEEHLRKSLDILELHPAAESRRLTESRLAMARLHAVKNEPQKARKIYAEMLPAYRSIIGVNHHDLVIELMTAGRFFLSQGDLDRAESLYTQAASVLDDCPGSQDSDKDFLLMEFGHLALAKGDPKTAEGLFRRAREFVLKTRGSWDPAVLPPYYALARVHLSQGRKAAAEAEVSSMCSVMRRRMGLEHPSNRTALARAREIYRRLGKPLPGICRTRAPEYGSAIILGAAPRP